MITLIATCHKEIEKSHCNSYELFKIIKAIEPEVIFGENSPEGWNKINEGLFQDSLETAAIKTYSKNNSLTYHPVDVDINKLIDKQIQREILDMFDIFNSFISYHELSNKHEELAIEYGFPYLNNDKCTEYFRSKYYLENELVKYVNNEKLTQTFRGWINIQEYREKEMIKSIYKFANSNKYNRAIFLIGAAHRWPIINKITRYEQNTKQSLSWELNHLPDPFIST